MDAVRAATRKIGRNDLCHCGSGKKFKRCCLSKPSLVLPPSPAQMQAALKFAREVQQRDIKERARIARFGKVRPEIATEAFGRTFVAVGAKLHWSEPGKTWMTFPDFLLDYTAHIFRKEWGDVELGKPFAERHPVVQWRCKTIEEIRKRSPVAGQVTQLPPSNFLAAFNSFAHDLYTVDHNGRLDESLLKRLKNKAEFEGARHELCAEATCHRAGFTIKHENQKDTSTRHAEFFATHKATGQEIAVEAKRRHRQPGKDIDFKFERLINEAVKKNTSLPLVIFLDTNLPTEMAEQFFGEGEGYLTKISKPMEGMLDRIRANQGGIDPYSTIVFTNHPHSLPSEEARAPIGLAVSCISTIPSRPVEHMDALLELTAAARMYYSVPNELPKSGTQSPDS
jgi:hypothetical protein